MKKLKIIILIILIVLIAIGSAVYAAIVANAPDVSYNKNGTTVSVKTELDDLFTKVKPKVGDIVNYKANASDASGTAFSTPYSYTSKIDETTGGNEYTGSTTATTFNSNDTATWKIMDINHDTGAIKLMEAGSFTKTLTLKGRAGYAYCENILNSASGVYGQGYGATGARSITVEDINQVTGYDPVKDGENGTSCGIHSQSYTSGNHFFDLTYENGKVKSFAYPKTASSSNPYTVTADSFYGYPGTTYLANTTNSYKMIFQNTSGSNRSYWLASRCVNFDSSYCNYGVRSVSVAYVSNFSLCSSWYSSVTGNNLPVCPVVSLDPTVKLTHASTSNGIKTWNITNAPSYRSVWFDANGGVFDNKGTTNVIRYNGSTKLSGTYKEPTKAGYDFGGWNTKADGSGTTYANESAIPSTSTMLYAKWKANTYTITYDGNGATSGNTASSSHTYGLAQKLTSNGFTRVGYDFLGWSEDSSSKIATYTDAQSVQNLTTINGSTVKLFAIWKSKPGWINEKVLGGSDVQVLSESYSTLPNEIWVDGEKQSSNSQTITNLSSGEHQVALDYADTIFNNMSFMFYGCTSLHEVVLSGLDTSNLSYMGGMFSGCTNLYEIDLGGFDASRVMNMNVAFKGCASLERLILPNSGASSVVYANNMFSGVTAELKIPVNFENMYSEALVNAINNYTGTKTTY